MTWKRNVLVLANVTAASEELVSDLTTRAAREPTMFTLLVPATPFRGGREAALQQLDEATQRLREEGLEVSGAVGDGDPIIAVTEVWNPKFYDEIVVSTLPMRFSKWLHAGLPERIERITGAPVSHVVSQPPKPEVPTTPAPVNMDANTALGPLSVLGWGGPPRA
jgi:hypothetical protein